MEFLLFFTSEVLFLYKLPPNSRIEKIEKSLRHMTSIYILGFVLIFPNHICTANDSARQFLME